MANNSVSFSWETAEDRIKSKSTRYVLHRTQNCNHDFGLIFQQVSPNETRLIQSSCYVNALFWGVFVTILLLNGCASEEMQTDF